MQAAKEAALQQSQGSLAGQQEDHHAALQSLYNATGDFFGGTVNEGPGRGVHSLPPLEVLRNEGFTLQVGER